MRFGRRPMRYDQTRKAMCHEHNIRPGALRGFLDNCYPLFANWVVPNTLLDTHKFGM